MFEVLSVERVFAAALTAFAIRVIRASNCPSIIIRAR